MGRQDPSHLPRQHRPQGAVPSQQWLLQKNMEIETAAGSGGVLVPLSPRLGRIDFLDEVEVREAEASGCNGLLCDVALYLPVRLACLADAHEGPKVAELQRVGVADDVAMGGFERQCVAPAFCIPIRPIDGRCRSRDGLQVAIRRKGFRQAGKAGLLPAPGGFPGRADSFDNNDHASRSPQARHLGKEEVGRFRQQDAAQE